MKMIVIFIFALSSPLWSQLNLFNFIATQALPFQKFCESLAPHEMIFSAVQNSLLCGSPLISQDIIRPLKQHALIHLFVVSGGHFVFLEKLLKHLQIPRVFHAPTLFLYNLFTGFQAPGTRSLTQMLVNRSASKLRFNLRDDQVQLLTGVILLGFFPELAQSISFLLSWTASLALSISSFQFYRHDPFKKIFYTQALISILLFPWLWSFGQGHPLGILSNLILGPVVLFLLFPLSAVAAIIPDGYPLFDRAVSSFEFLLVHSADVFPSFSKAGIQLDFFWLYLFSLHFLFHWHQVHHWQKSR